MKSRTSAGPGHTGKSRRASGARLRARTPVAPEALLVLGMHRSGTSAVARMFNLLGADLSGNLMDAGPANEAGHWESLDLFTLHEQLLASAGSRWDDWRAFNPDWLMSGVAEGYKDKLVGMLERDFGESTLLVVKDPRICRFVPLWLDALDRFGAKPRIVIPFRNPLEVAASLKLRDQFSPAKSYLLWLRHVLDAEHATRNLPRAIVSFDALLADWRSIARTVTANTEVHWPRRSDPAELEIDNFIAAALRHHTTDKAALSKRADVASWIKETYGVLCQIEDRGESPAQSKRLDRIRAEFDRACSAFGVLLLAETQQGEAQIRSIETQIVGHRAEIDRLSRELMQARDFGTQAQAAAAASGSKLAELDQQLAAAVKMANDRERQIAELSRKLISDETALRQRDLEIERLARELDAARLFLRDSQSEVQKFAGEYDAACAEIARLDAEHRRALEAAAATSGELNAVRTRAQHLQKERDELERSARDLVAATQHERNELERSARELAAAAQHERDELERSARDLVAATQDNATLRTTVAGLRLEINRHESRVGELSENLRFTAAKLHGAEQGLDQVLLEQEKGLIANAGEMNGLKCKLVDTEAALARATTEKRQSWTKPIRSRASVRRLMRSGLFDAEWYLRKYPDVHDTSRRPAEHYLHEGYLRGYRPNPLFDTRWYLEQYEDVRLSGVNPVLHYAAHGCWEGRDPNPLFDSDWYLKRNADVGAAGINPLAHYLNYGAAEGRDPHPLFDRDWYLQHSPDVRDAGVDPSVHYLESGAMEGRDPCPLFDTDWYVKHNRDVRVAGVNPLVHYLQHGGTEGRSPGPLFDAAWYLECYADVRAAGINPLVHYLEHGAAEGRDPNPAFSTTWYLDQYPDVRVTGLNPLVHYLLHGAAEGRDPSPNFDTDWYVQRYPDVGPSGINPLAHYLRDGAAAGRDPLPVFEKIWASVDSSSDRTKIRTIAISHNLNHEGAPNSQLELIMGLQRRGTIEPVVLSPHDGPLLSAYHAARIPTLLLQPPNVSSASTFQKSLAPLASAFRESGAEIVYANTLQTFWAIAVAERAGLPAIWNVRESEPWQTYFDYLAPDLRPVAYRMFRCADRVIFVSEATRRAWEPVNDHDTFALMPGGNGFDVRHNFRVIRNGLNLDRLRMQNVPDRRVARAQERIADGDVAVVLLGTVCERKGQLDLVRAFKAVPAEVASKLRIFIVGDRASRYSELVHREAAELPDDRSGRLTIVPETGQPYAYFRAADIAICCSRLESYPRVTLEAMAFELPLITTPVFGIAEQVQEGVNALLYEPGDIAGLATHIARLTGDSELRHRMAAASCGVLKRLPDYDEMLDAYAREFSAVRARGNNAAITRA